MTTDTMNNPQQSMATDDEAPWVVMKFGGTSVSQADTWAVIRDRVRQERANGRQVMVVVSAVAGVTDLLGRLAEAPPLEVAEELLADLDRIHEALAESLGVEPGEAFLAARQELGALLDDPAASGLVGDGWRARLQSYGERLSSALGQQVLAQGGEAVVLDSALNLLTVDPEASAGPLAAYCREDPDPALARRLVEAGPIHITQGFMARGLDGEPWLLGRGGSDTTAALLAARLGATELQIWTDVPGVFSADPNVVPGARLLRRLSYSEAQEFAAMGARVLHPPCIGPVRRHGIALSIRDTRRPDSVHTAVGPRSAQTEGLVKGVISRGNITLINLDSITMWHQPGFLADAFGLFKRHGLSIDLVSTSESSVTVSLDPRRPGRGPAQGLDPCLQELEALCDVTVKTGCVAISLVGNAIRTLLGRLSDALDLFQDRTIHLVTQSANDLNFTLVVDADQADRLVQKLHAKLIAPIADHQPEFGPSWSELNEAGGGRPEGWWESRSDELQALVEQGPAYVYDLGSVRAAARRLMGLSSIGRVLYAVKANHHPDILRALADEGVRFECVSPGEVDHVLREVPGAQASELLFTPNFAAREEYTEALERGVRLTVDNLYPLEAWPEVFRGQSVFLRLDLDAGFGHHRKVVTSGAGSKFGIPLHQLDRVREIATREDITIAGLHAHTGSGVSEPEVWKLQLERFLDVLPDFPDARVIDLGGGLGVPERRDQAPFDLDALDALLATLPVPQGVELWLEPGRYLVSEAGVLLARVNQTKSKGDQAYLGIEIGMNTLLRPALYGAYHDIVNLTRLGEDATHRYTVVGPICETGDILGESRYLPKSEEGDVLLIANAGAYGRVMASDYNLRAPARELIL
jgi:diaminopimelate decarboxylase/aspartate kinase